MYVYSFWTKNKKGKKISWNGSYHILSLWILFFVERSSFFSWVPGDRFGKNQRNFSKAWRRHKLNYCLKMSHAVFKGYSYIVVVIICFITSGNLGPIFCMDY